MTKPIRKPRLNIPQKIVRAVKEFEKATNEYAFIGSRHPDDWEEITTNYNKKKLKLYYAIQEFKDGK